MVTGLAQLLGQPGQLELESDSEGQGTHPDKGHKHGSTTQTADSPMWCLRPKVVSWVLFTLKTSTSSCLFFPWTLVYFRMDC